ncbi:MAG TPA: uroporphyrinogen-III synthase [Burkholderiaceae bacterium]
MPSIQVIVTRPAPEAGTWVQALAARGIAAQALPLIEIAPATDAASVRLAWAGLPRCSAAMFVSGNAVAHFFAARPAGQAWPQATRAWATGPGTARALREAGVPASQIDSPAADNRQFDSEALWGVVAPQAVPGARMLIVHGGGGRDWLAQHIRQTGAQVDSLAAYRRQPPQFSPAQQTLARTAAQDGTLWLFSSAEAVTHLRAALPGMDWSRARALATHPRIAAAVQAAGFAEVRMARPALDDVVASIESAA